jgi:hypothetical protein
MRCSHNQFIPIKESPVLERKQKLRGNESARTKRNKTKERQKNEEEKVVFKVSTEMKTSEMIIGRAGSSDHKKNRRTLWMVVEVSCL